LLQEFCFAFTRPSFVLFVYILTGWALTSRHRFITECIFTSGQVGNGHWSRFHRFFSHNRWSLDFLFMLLAKLLITVFAPTGPILLAADDTLCRKRGLTLYGAGLSLLGAIDDGVGRIRTRLKEMGQDRRTLIFFISDNGAPLGNAWDGSLNTPMREQKGMLSEGGIRVPFSATWPGTIPAGPKNP
jgi:hypothetical protein